MCGSAGDKCLLSCHQARTQLLEVPAFVDPAQRQLLGDGPIMAVALSVTALALLGKLIGCGASMLGLGRRSMAIVGVGMAPRGEST